MAPSLPQSWAASNADALSLAFYPDAFRDQTAAVIVRRVLDVDVAPECPTGPNRAQVLCVALIVFLFALALPPATVGHAQQLDINFLYNLKGHKCATLLEVSA